MIDVLYIAGAGRSGSTLLERLLGQLPDTVAVGELRHLWREDPTRARCGCGRLLPECDFWCAVLEQTGVPISADAFRDMRAAQLEVDRIRFVPRMVAPRLAGREYSRRRADYEAMLRRLYAAVLAVGGGRVVVDSSKDVSTLYLLGQMAGIRLNVLHLVRDSRAVAYSWTKELVRPQVVGQLSYMERYSPARSALDWAYRNVLSGRTGGQGLPFMRLRYEDLIADPPRALRRVADFAGLAGADPGFVGPAEIALTRATHTVAGNPMKFGESRLRLRLDNAWQQALPPRDRAVVTALTWPLLWRYGYGRTAVSSAGEPGMVEG